MAKRSEKIQKKGTIRKPTGTARRPMPAAARRKKPGGAANAQTDAALPSAVVAIGASAGGLEAFSQVLERLEKNPNVAFIFVQHLSPQHSSALPELLSAKTTLRVVQ